MFQTGKTKVFKKAVKKAGSLAGTGSFKTYHGANTLVRTGCSPSKKNQKKKAQEDGDDPMDMSFSGTGNVEARGHQGATRKSPRNQNEDNTSVAAAYAVAGETGASGNLERDPVVLTSRRLQCPSYSTHRAFTYTHASSTAYSRPRR